MAQINFSGAGTESIDNQVGKGKGLKVGTTKLNFADGKIQFNDAETIGNFRTLKQKGAISNEVKSFSFKCSTKCTIIFQDTFIEYNLINEWLILQGIQTEEITISRTATGVNPDIFAFNFIASDDVNYKLSIEKGTRDSDSEVLFESVSRAVDTYLKTFNVQGASKINLMGKGTAGLGTVALSLEQFDPASNDWFELVPVEGLYTLVNTEKKIAQIGDTISRINEPTNNFWAQNSTNTSAIVDTSAYVRQGVILPSGDGILRVKAIVTINTLTFSLGVTKVFN